MPFLKTSAQNTLGLLQVIRDFVTSHGWTVGYDTTDKENSGQLGLQTGNIRVGIGLKMRDNSTTVDYQEQHTQKISGGEVTDSTIVMSLTTRFNLASSPSYWLNDGVYNSDLKLVNDLTGPFSAIWLFTNKEKNGIICVVKSSLYRYTTFGFGTVSTPGANLPEPFGFMFGCYYTWWEDDTLKRYNSLSPNDFGSIRHNFLTDTNQICVYVPDKCLDPAYFPYTFPYFDSSVKGTFHRYSDLSDYNSYSEDKYILDYFGLLQNQTTTGGVPLVPIPIIFRKKDYRSYVGDIPLLRLVKIGAINPEQTIQYGNSEWYCFPWKQKGLFQNSKEGSSPTKDPNTFDLGFAILANDEENP